MFIAFVIAAVAGGTLLITSLFGHHESVDLDGDGIPDVDADTSAGSLTSLVLSLRFWAYFLGIGGITGLLLTAFGGLAAGSTLALAIAVGLITGVAASVVVARASRSAGGLVKSSEMRFRLGTVLTGAAPGQSSRVRVTINNQALDLIARSDDPAPLVERDEVIILDMHDGVALVTRNPPEEKEP